jgi:uncharacterized protein (DUF952 family)
MIYHIVSKTDWETVRKSEFYQGDTLETEGFIHCSDAGQVVDVANFRFRGRTDLLLLEIDPAKLTQPLKYEDGGDGDGRLFPHVYGPIEVAAVLRVLAFPPSKDGNFSLPAGIREE